MTSKPQKGTRRTVAALSGAAPAILLLFSLFTQAEVCTAPPALQARARTTADGTGFSDLGTWFGQHQQFACATQAFRSSLRQNPKSAMVHYFLALSLSSAGDTEAALPPLARAIRLDPRVMQPRALRANILSALDRRPEAEQEWRALLKQQPASPEALDGLANALLADRDYSAVIDLLRKAPPNENLTLDLAAAYGNSGRLAEAEAALNEARRREPASLRLTRALATVYVHQHRYQDAAALLRTSVEQHPRDLDAAIQYLSILVLTSDTATARPLAKKLLAAEPHNFEVLSMNGILEREAEDYAAARDHLAEAVALQPDDYTAHYNLGATLAHLDQPAAARAQLEKAIALEPFHPEPHFQLAAVLRSTQQTEAAQRELALYERLKKDTAAQAEAESKAEQAALKFAAGDTTQAIALYRQAVESTPQDALLRYRLSLALDRAADLPAERQALQAAVDLDPTFALAQNQLGFLILRAGDAATAEKHLQAAVDSAPAFTVAWINLAATLASESRFPEARRAAATALRLEPGNVQASALSRQLAAAAPH